MNGYFKAFAFFGVFLAAALAFPVAYGESEVVLSLGKNLYVSGESVVVMGIVQSPSNSPVIIQVWSPNNKECGVQSVIVNDDGSFKAEPVLLSGDLCGIEGTYTVKAFYGQFEGSTTFEVKVLGNTNAGNGNLQILLDIMNRAQQNVDNKIADYQASGNTVPEDIDAIYQGGLAEVKLTKEAADLDSVKNHVKNALMAFREVYASLVVLEMDTESASVDPAEEISELKQTIVRAIEFKNKLTSTAGATGVGAVETSLEAFDDAIAESTKYLEAGDLDAAREWLAEANHILDDIHKSLIQNAEKQRLEKFTTGLENKANTLKEVAKASDDSEALAAIEQAVSLITEAGQSISEGNYDLAKNHLRQANDLLNSV
ncbi:MAG: cellobiose-specific phosphotransferase system component IIA [Candidatus Nitrosomirales archaeon]|jgi:cellobiose-specific phosphotransferase system component IIA